jgi:uncharacterized protein YpmB
VNKKIRNIFILFLVLSFVIAVSGCTDNKEASNAEKSEKVEATEKAGAAEKDTKKSEKPDQEVQDFVLQNTKIVKIFNINKRINEKYPDLGPFQVVRGIDQRGQKSEIWIKDMKIYEMINSGSNQTSEVNSSTEENTASEGN